jgi:hypothetical protein
MRERQMDHPVDLGGRTERNAGKRARVVVAKFLQDAPTFVPKALRMMNRERPEFVAT